MCNGSTSMEVSDLTDAGHRGEHCYDKAAQQGLKAFKADEGRFMRDPLPNVVLAQETRQAGVEMLKFTNLILPQKAWSLRSGASGRHLAMGPSGPLPCPLKFEG